MGDVSQVSENRKSGEQGDKTDMVTYVDEDNAPVMYEVMEYV